MTSGPLKIAESRTGAVCIVSLSGRIDSTNAEQLSAHLARLITAKEASVLVDFQDVSYLTSAGFRVLLLATDEAARGGVAFALCGVRAYVRELFEIGGLMECFVVHESRDEALARLG